MKYCDQVHFVKCGSQFSVFKLPFSIFHLSSPADDDYIPVMDSPLQFSSEVRRACVVISIVNDSNIVEPDQIFTVSLDSTDPVTFTPFETASVTITDDEGQSVGLYASHTLSTEGIVPSVQVRV